LRELVLRIEERICSIFCIEVKKSSHESESRMFGRQWAMLSRVLQAKMFFSFGEAFCLGIEKSQRESMKLFLSFFHPRIPEMLINVCMLFRIYWMLVSFDEISNRILIVPSKF
jgi:hypothetical protein